MMRLWLRKLPALPILFSFGITVVLLLLFAALSREMVEGETVGFDAEVRQAIHSYASPAVTTFMIVVTTAGSVASTSVLAMVTSLWLWRAGHWRRSVLVIVCVGGGLVLMGVLKLAFARTRPEPFFDTPLPAGYSFPSGHTLVSCCFYCVAAAFAAAHQRRIAIRALIWFTAAAVVLLIGTSRVYLGVHYPSDVLAGYLAAGVWVSGIAHAYRRWSGATPP